MQSDSETRKCATRNRSFVDRRQVLVGLVGAGFMIGLALYAAVLTAAGLLGGHPAYAASTDVYGSPHVVAAAFPCMFSGATPALLRVKGNGTSDVVTLSSLGLPGTVQLVGARNAPLQRSLAAQPVRSGLLSGRLPNLLGLP